MRRLLSFLVTVPVAVVSVVSCSDVPSAIPAHPAERVAAMAPGQATTWTPTALDGAAPAFAFDVNLSGRIAGSITESGASRAVVWVRVGDSPDRLALAAGTDWSRAFAINVRGQVVGQSQDRSVSPVRVYATLWSSNDAAPVLLPAGTTATSINDRGSIAGTIRTESAELHAGFWANEESEPVDLGTLGGTSSSASDLNNDAWIVGISRDASNNLRAAFWAGPAAAPIALAQPAGALRSTATGINDRGEIVGDYFVTSTIRRALYWASPDAAPIELAGLGGGTSQAVSIDDRGRIVGWASTVTGQMHACVWLSATDAPIDLGTLGGTTSFARAIDPRGRIVGDAQDVTGAQRATAWSR